jgi:hypothetical protein
MGTIERFEGVSYVYILVVSSVQCPALAGIG